MRGKHRIIVSTKRLKYDFELRRNLTIIRGDSATGKTTLVDMIREFVNNPSGTPVDLVCDKACYVLEGAMWKEQLSGMSDSMVFIDEGNEFIKTVEFAQEIQKTDNYYVIVTREALPSLPYSIEEIYGMRQERDSQKYQNAKRIYNETYQLYNLQAKEDIQPDLVITEDSNSGYEFYHKLFGETCCSAEGKSNILSYLQKSQGKEILKSAVLGNK